MVRCIRCGVASDEELLSVDVESANVHCGGCGEGFSVDDIKAQIDGWTKIVKWIEQHPIFHSAE